ncbi:MAG: hypothetical protein WA989_01020, partial [Henriciella sp.]|uniref:hypothetical protein n=1 Tax=Henriciella sp. TaxID=1968823 RepID=UPI003C72B7BE
GSWNEAIEDATVALETYPNNVEALLIRSRAWLNRDDLGNAETDMNRALLIDGKNIDTLVLRGDIREAKRLASDG